MGGDDQAPVPRPARYRVYDDDRLALEITDAPGALVSAASPPPSPERGVQTHPFLSAVAHLPVREGELRRILDASGSTDDFLEQLRRAGYRVEAVA